MYKLFLSLRYLSRRRIAFFAIGAVTLCVAMVLIVVSVMGGFLDMIKARSRGLLGDIVMDNFSLQGFAWYEEFMDEALELPEINAATPVIYNYGILRFPRSNITKPVKIVGIRLDEAYVVNGFKDSLYYEKHYPGSTTLGDQQQPVWAWSEQGDKMLPFDLETALKSTGWTPNMPEDKNAHPLEFDGGPGNYTAWPIFCSMRAQTLSQRAQTLAIETSEAWESVQRNDAPPPPPVENVLANLLVDAEELRERLNEMSATPEMMDKLQAFEDQVRWAQTHNTNGDKAKVSAAMNTAALEASDLFSLVAARTQPGYVGDALPGIVIGTDLIDEPDDDGEYSRHWPRGHKVLLTFLPLTRKGVLSGVQAPVKAMRYVDDSRTGVYQIDSLSVYVDFDFVQDILMMSPQRLTDELGGGMTPARTTQVQFKLAPGTSPEKAKAALKAAWEDFAERKMKAIPPGPLDSELEQLAYVQFDTWEERQQEFVAAVEKEKTLVTILFGVVSIVAVFLVGCVFYMIVQEKTRDIGIIKSIGATSAGVGSIFLSYGAAVGVVGSIVGTTLGAIFVWYINDIQDLLIRINPGLRVWSRKVYSFDTIPNTVKAFDVTWIVGIAIAASVLGSVMAAWRAARVWPVEAIRYE